MNTAVVRCPHCGDQGQITLSQILSVSIGPCPQCGEPVALVGNKPLPLQRSIMETGAPQTKIDHIMHVINGFLNRCIIEPM